jgi:nucleotide-binding universal stress UspA family protein
MTLPRTLLVPTDFSESANAALDYAIELAAKVDGKIILLHAFEIPTVGFPDASIAAATELGRRILEGARMGLDATLSARQDARVPIRACVEQDAPLQAILDVTRREKVDLILMGTHGRRGLSRALLGSIAEKVVRAAPVPVLVVRRTEDDGARA